MTARRHLEDDECMALIAWRDLHVKRYPLLALLIHIPNGGQRHPREAARLKAMGVKKGVHDYLLPVSRIPKDIGQCSVLDSLEGKRIWCGLWIEEKSEGGAVSQEQRDWRDAMRIQLYRAEICYGWVEAARVICDYMGIPEIAP